MAAFLTVLSCSQHIPSALRTNLDSAFFQAIFAERLLERRTEKTRLFRFLVQVRSLGNCLVVDRRTALLAYIPVIGIVATANRTFNGIVNLSLLMAPIAPDAACSTIRHAGTLPQSSRIQ